MTRLLYWNNPFQELAEMNDTQLGTIVHYLQQAYANQLNVNGAGAFFASASNSNAGSATDTRRTQRSHPAFFIGTGTQSVGTFFYEHNISANVGLANNVFAPLYWNGDAIQRSTSSTLISEIFETVRNLILSGNDLGSYRIQANSPGTGWVNKNDNIFRDTIYNNQVQTQYRLWLKTGGVNPPNPNNTQEALQWNGNDIQRLATTSVNSSLIANYLLPHFSAWAISNGLRWRVDTFAQGTTRSTFIDTRRSTTQNTLVHTDAYVSTPVGSAVQFEMYFFNAT